jgi:hypothetical protein
MNLSGCCGAGGDFDGGRGVGAGEAFGAAGGGGAELAGGGAAFAGGGGAAFGGCGGAAFGGCGGGGAALGGCGGGGAALGGAGGAAFGGVGGAAFGGAGGGAAFGGGPLEGCFSCPLCCSRFFFSSSVSGASPVAGGACANSNVPTLSVALSAAEETKDADRTRP